MNKCKIFFWIVYVFLTILFFVITSKDVFFVKGSVEVIEPNTHNQLALGIYMNWLNSLSSTALLVISGFLGYVLSREKSNIFEKILSLFICIPFFISYFCYRETIKRLTEVIYSAKTIDLNSFYIVKSIQSQELWLAYGLGVLIFYFLFGRGAKHA